MFYVLRSDMFFLYEQHSLADGVNIGLYNDSAARHGATAFPTEAAALRAIEREKQLWPRYRFVVVTFGH